MARVASFSEATYIALHSMVLIAENGGERISIKNMAARLHVSEAHLAKVIMRLSHSGLIDTVRGPKGGAVLARLPEEISFLQILESIEGPLERSECVFGRRTCVYQSCIFEGFLKRLTEEAREWLAKRNLADFINTGTGVKTNEKDN